MLNHHILARIFTYLSPLDVTYLTEDPVFGPFAFNRKYSDIVLFDGPASIVPTERTCFVDYHILPMFMSHNKHLRPHKLQIRDIRHIRYLDYELLSRFLAIDHCGKPIVSSDLKNLPLTNLASITVDFTKNNCARYQFPPSLKLLKASNTDFSPCLPHLEVLSLCTLDSLVLSSFPRTLTELALYHVENFRMDLPLPSTLTYLELAHVNFEGDPDLAYLTNLKKFVVYNVDWNCFSLPESLSALEIKRSKVGSLEQVHKLVQLRLLCIKFCLIDCTGVFDVEFPPQLKKLEILAAVIGTNSRHVLLLSLPDTLESLCVLKPVSKSILYMDVDTYFPNTLKSLRLVNLCGFKRTEKRSQNGIHNAPIEPSIDSQVQSSNSPSHHQVFNEIGLEFFAANALPDSLIEISFLRMNLKRLPWDIGKLPRLRRVNLAGNNLAELPKFYNLDYLDLTGNPIVLAMDYETKELHISADNLGKDKPIAKESLEREGRLPLEEARINSIQEHLEKQGRSLEQEELEAVFHTKRQCLQHLQKPYQRRLKLPNTLEKLFIEGSNAGITLCELELPHTLRKMHIFRCQIPHLELPHLLVDLSLAECGVTNEKLARIELPYTLRSLDLSSNMLYAKVDFPKHITQVTVDENLIPVSGLKHWKKIIEIIPRLSQNDVFLRNRSMIENMGCVYTLKVGCDTVKVLEMDNQCVVCAEGKEIIIDRGKIEHT